MFDDIKNMNVQDIQNEIEKNEETTKLQIRIDSLEKQLNAQKIELEDKKAKLKEKEFDLIQQSMQVEADRNEVEKEKVRLQKQNDLLTEKELSLSSREQEQITKENELAEREFKVKDSENSVAREIEQRRHQLHIELETAKINIDNEINQKKVEAENEMLQWKDNKWKEVVVLCETRRKKTDEELSEYRNRELRRINEEIEAERKKGLEALEAEKHKLIADAEQELAMRKQQQGELEKKLQEQITQNQIAYNDMQNRINAIAQEKDELEWSKSRLNDKQEELERRASLLNDEIQEKYGNIIRSEQDKTAIYQDELDASRERCKMLAKELEGYDTIKSMVNGNPREILDNLNHLQKEREELLDKLRDAPDKDLVEKYNNLKDSYERLKMDYEAQADNYRKQTEEVLKVNELTAKNIVLEDEKKNLETLLDTQKDISATLTAEIKRLRSGEEKLQEREARIRSIEQDYIENVENPTRDGQPENEIEWLNAISKNCYEYGIAFPKRILYAFHTALKIADWASVTVLAGVSGTGKSELPRLYCTMGRMNYINVPVQPNWDSQESMLGFFNSIDNRFDAQPVLRFLAQCATKLNKCVNVVLLDEMNLAHVEYYFADFLSKLETRRGMDKNNVPKIEVKLGADYDPYEIPLSRNILWCGTMNQDETTKSLSDKVLDRGLVINFPRPTELKSRVKMGNLNEFIKTHLSNVPMLHYSQWRRWIATEITEDGKYNNIKGFKGEQRKKLEDYRKLTQEINRYLGEVGRALGHRVWQSIEYYIANYPEVIAAKQVADEGVLTGELKEAMRIAYEDQIVQKIMPKLRGIDTHGDARDNCLDPIRTLLEKEGFDGLNKDFDNACKLGYGQFIWCSAEYIDDEIAGVPPKKGC